MNNNSISMSLNFAEIQIEDNEKVLIKQIDELLKQNKNEEVTDLLHNYFGKLLSN